MWKNSVKVALWQVPVHSHSVCICIDKFSQIKAMSKMKILIPARIIRILKANLKETVA